MSGRATEDLVAELARGVTAVKPIVRLRVAAIAVVVLWAVSVLSGGWLGVIYSEPVAALAEWGTHLLVLVGLAAVAVGGVVAALASAVPGREASVRGGRALASIGAAVSLGAGLGALTAVAAAPPPGGLIAGSAGCLLRAVAIGVLPVLAACFFVGRGSSAHLRISMAWGAGGAIALGAVAVHASCTMVGAYHVLLGHCIAPLLAGGLLALPLAALAARFAGADSRA